MNLDQPFFLALLSQGKIEIVDQKPETGIVIHQHSVSYGEEGLDRGHDERRADNEIFCAAEAWPGDGRVSVQDSKYRAIRWPWSAPDIFFDFMPVVHTITGVRELMNVKNFIKYCQHENWTFCPSTSIMKFLKFRDEQAYLEYCQAKYDVFDDSVFLTKEEHEAREHEREKVEKQRQFKKMNKWVSTFAKQCSVMPMSLEFLDALSEHLDNEIEGWRSRIEGAKEDGLCIGMGATIESWYDHVEGLNIGLDRSVSLAEQVWDWCDEELPLLMAKWREARETASNA